ncbi:MAG: hypothetical protein P8P80_04810 [Crocinitomicaceae bacterium]|jgi:hypothetical protein|nr:hypothetical protein [Crocinitomicaceae bacterium]MDG1735687.1 hypothetical protein [Crocinitomicaceae bacterium]MDG2504736.1 hypothetical protein [Crocinitomicaceae bacterium]
MKLLTEDERFREYLMGFDEYKLCEEAKEYIPTAVKRQSLISCAAYLSDFIVDNLNENAIDIEAPEELQQIQVISFIESLPRQCIQSFYQNYMESYGVIEDLMILNEHNRLHLLYQLTRHSFEYLELINKEILN